MDTVDLMLIMNRMNMRVSFFCRALVYNFDVAFAQIHRINMASWFDQFRKMHGHCSDARTKLENILSFIPFKQRQYLFSDISRKKKIFEPIRQNRDVIDHWNNDIRIVIEREKHVNRNRKPNNRKTNKKRRKRTWIFKHPHHNNTCIQERDQNRTNNAKFYFIRARKIWHFVAQHRNTTNNCNVKK